VPSRRVAAVLPTERLGQHARVLVASRIHYGLPNDVVRHPPVQRPDPGEQLVQVERFGQVVVRAAVESAHPLGVRAERGQDQHARGHRAPPQAGEQVQSVHVGQPPVDHHDAVRPTQSQVQTALAVVGDVHAVAQVGQDVRQVAAGVHFVVHNQDARLLLAHG